MYRVLIAEDELLVRMGLKHSVNWNGFNMTVVADKADGESAYNAYEELKPDLIITDIRMPGMNGIDFIKKIRSNDQSSVIIIVTCLEDLNLAREAIRLGVSNYLLKATMTDEEINGTLSHALSLLQSRERIKSINGDIKNHVAIREDIIRDYLIHNGTSQAQFAERAVQLGMEFLLNPVYLILIEQDEVGQAESYLNASSENTITNSIKDIIKEKFPASNTCFVLYIDSRHILAFLKKDECDADRLLGSLDSIRKSLNIYFEMSITIAVQLSENGNLMESYLQCRKLLSYKYIYGYGQTITQSVIVEIGDIIMNRFQILAVTNSVFGSKTHDILFEGIPDEVCRNPAALTKYVKDRLIELLKLFADTSSRQHTNSVLKAHQAIISSAVLTDAVNEMIVLMKQNNELRSHAGREDIKKAKDIIDVEYGGSLAMQDVASRVGLSSNYFSSLFKQETGEHYVSYLNAIRLTKAKELLSNTQLYLYEIAEKTGFADETYFSRIFKRETGFSPSDWRKAFYEKKDG